MSEYEYRELCEIDDLRAEVKGLKDERHDLQERLDASMDKYEAMGKHVNLLTELVDAVKSSEFDGIYCEDVSSGNWFDARTAATKER